MIEKIKNFFIRIATLNSLGNWFFGGVVSALLAIPFLYLLQFLYSALPSLFHSAWIGMILLCLISIYFALSEHRRSIVLHKFIGVMIAFYCITLTFKVVFAGILLFYIFDYLISLFIFKVRDLTGLGKFNQMIHLIIPSIVSGLAVNLFLRFVLWIAH